jgi:hypothetical protein
MKFGTQTKTDMLGLTITKAEEYGEKHKKITVKSDVILKGNVVCARSYKEAKKFYSPVVTSILIQQVVKQSWFDSHLLRLSAPFIFVYV